MRLLVGELIEARRLAALSQQAMAAELGRSQPEVSRLEQLMRIDDVSFVRVAEVASLLGLELSARLHALGDPIRDKGHQALIDRFRAVLAAAWRVAAEVPFPIPGDARSWDLVLRLHDLIIGVEAETRIRDIQALTRHVHHRERDGGVDEIVLLCPHDLQRHLAAPTPAGARAALFDVAQGDPGRASQRRAAAGLRRDPAVGRPGGLMPGG